MTVQPNDMLHRTYLMGLINERPDMSKDGYRQKYIGKSLMGWKEVPERRMLWDIRYSENPLAGIYGPKGEAIPFDNMLFSSMMADLVDVKAKKLIDPQIVTLIRSAGEITMYTGGSPGGWASAMRSRVQEEVTKAVAECDDYVDSTYEYLAVRSLLGLIEWPPRDPDGNIIPVMPPHWNHEFKITFPYPFRAGMNQTVTTMTGFKGRTGAGLYWDQTNSDPIDDLELINEYAAETYGIELRGGTIYMASSVLGMLAKRSTILQWIVGTNKEQPGARQYVDQEEIRSLVKTRLGWNIQTYDAHWTYRVHVDGTKPVVNRVRFMPRNKIIIVPPGGLPNAFMGTAPILDENGNWVYGKMPWSYTQPKPNYEIEVGLNCVMWPVHQTFDHAVLAVLP